MKHLTTSEYIERVRTLGFGVAFTLAKKEIVVTQDNNMIVSVRVDTPYRMNSDWYALTEHLSNNSLVREMLVEALLIITTRYANTPIEKRNLRYETSVSSNINIEMLREYQMQIQTIIETENEVDY